MARSPNGFNGARARRSLPASVGVDIPWDGRDKVTGAALYRRRPAGSPTRSARTHRALSTVANARIVSVTLDPSFDWTGMTVVDHRDIPGENCVAVIERDQPMLASTHVRHVDEPILLLAHGTPNASKPPCTR